MAKTSERRADIEALTMATERVLAWLRWGGTDSRLAEKIRNEAVAADLSYDEMAVRLASEVRVWLEKVREQTDDAR